MGNAFPFGEGGIKIGTSEPILMTEEVRPEYFPGWHLGGFPV